MDSVALVVGSCWVFAGLVFVGVSLPLVRQKIPRNPFYGVRLRRSMQSDEAWYAINRFGGQRMIVWAIPLILIGLVALFLPLQTHPGLAIALGVGPLIFVAIPLVETMRFARRYPPRA